MIAKIVVAFAIFLVAGCWTIEQNPVVEPTRPWEGRYSTAEEFKAGTANIAIDENECVWVLRGQTLKRLLKNTEAR